MFLFVLVVAVIGLEGPAADGVMGQNVIGQHQRMAADRVAEVEADAVPLHLAAGEIQVGFAVLDGIFQHRVIAGQLHFQRRIAKLGIVRQQVLQDLDHGLVVKDALVAALRGQPEPGPQDQVIAMAVFTHPGPAGLGDDAVEFLGAFAAVDLNCGMGADQGVEIQVLAGGQRLDLIFEKLVQVVAAVETKKNQRVCAKGSGQAAKTLGLLERGIHWLAPDITKQIKITKNMPGAKDYAKPPCAFHPLVAFMAMLAGFGWCDPPQAESPPMRSPFERLIQVVEPRAALQQFDIAEQRRRQFPLGDNAPIHTPRRPVARLDLRLLDCSRLGQGLGRLDRPRHRDSLAAAFRIDRQVGGPNKIGRLLPSTG